jgi:hypothetical protein
MGFNINLGRSIVNIGMLAFSDEAGISGYSKIIFGCNSISFMSLCILANRRLFRFFIQIYFKKLIIFFIFPK